MAAKDLRELFVAWAAPIRQVTPPDISVIRRRVRRRAMWRLAGAAAATAACALTAVLLVHVGANGYPVPSATKTTRPTHREVGPSPVSAAPYYITLGGGHGAATVRRTATGAKLAVVPRPGGAAFIGVAAGGDDRTFVLAAQTSSATPFYRLRLSQEGRPSGLVLIAGSTLPSHFGGCSARLAGLAVSPDARLLAISLLSNCPNGRSGPGEILTVRLGSGRTVATFHLGDGYPMWLSWTAAGSLAYRWTGTQTGIFVIPDATDPRSSPRMLISSAASVGGFSGADYPLITPDGSAVIATVARGSLTFAIAEFSVRGRARWLLTPPVRNPGRYCGPLWTDASGRRLLTGCGDNSEYQIQNRHLTKVHEPWQLPIYTVPSGPHIAW